MQVKTANGKEMELKEAVYNGSTYVPHQELKTLARQDGVMFDFPHIIVENFASAMCVVSNMQGVRCYGTGQAPSLAHATDLAFDNAVIDLYGIDARSAVEVDITAAAARKAAKAEKERKANEEAAAKEAAAKKAAEEAAKKKAAEEAAAKEAAARKAAEEAAKKKAAEEAAAKEAAAKKAAEEAAKKKAAEEAAAKEAAARKAAEEAAKKKAAEEAAAKEAAARKAAEEAAARKAAEEAAAKEAAAKKAAEEAAARKAAEEAAAKEAAAKKAAEEAAARKAAEEAATKQDSASTAPRTGYWYANEADWVGCHSLTPNDPDDTVINYGPFKDTGENSELKPGPKYLSQVLKYRREYIEKLIGIQPPTFAQRIAQILSYCSRQGVGLHATSSKAHDVLAQYGVREL